MTSFETMFCSIAMYLASLNAFWMRNSVVSLVSTPVSTARLNAEVIAFVSWFMNCFSSMSRTFLS